MKNPSAETTRDIFAEYELSIEEMFNVRGGDKSEPIMLPPNPPILI